MAPLALAQIDENSSLLQANGNDPLLLPTAIGHILPLSDSFGEKTPEACSRRVSLGGDSSPEAWPNTPTWDKIPTPQGMRLRSGFALGDQTPESWPEFAPSFRLDMQQPDCSAACEQDRPLQGAPMPQQENFQGMPTLNAMAGFMPMMIPSVNAIPGQMSCPLGMVFNSNVMNVPSFNGVNMGVLRSGMSLPAPNASPFVFSADRVADKASSGKAALDTGAAKHKPSTHGKKAPLLGNSDAGEADDAVPVAVYVDLSALRERPNFAGQGCSRQ